LRPVGLSKTRIAGTARLPAFSRRFAHSPTAFRGQDVFRIPIPVPDAIFQRLTARIDHSVKFNGLPRASANAAKFSGSPS